MQNTSAYGRKIHTTELWTVQALIGLIDVTIKFLFLFFIEVWRLVIIWTILCQKGAFENCRDLFWSYSS